MRRQKVAYFLKCRKIFRCLAPSSNVHVFGHNGLYLQQLSFERYGLPKTFGDWKYASTYCKVAYGRLF